MRSKLFKILLSLVCISWIPIHSFAQKNPSQLYRTVSIDDSTAMDATEVTITEWVYFILNNNFDPTLFPDASNISTGTSMFFDDLKKGRDFEYIKLIDNNRTVTANYGYKGFIRTKKIKQLTAADSNYFSLLLPVTGISFAQAQRFCVWREANVNRGRAIKVRITLPSIELYKKVNVNKDSLCKAELHCDSCNGYQFNYAHQKCSLSTKFGQVETAGQGLMRADAFWPSVLGLYNIQGNAAEMTATEGIAVGGSFNNFALDSYSDKIQSYTKAANWLGFRCLITLQ